MTEEVVVRVTVDKKLERRASTVLKKIGLTTSDALRMMMIRIAKEGTLPFEPLSPSQKTIEAIRKAEKSGYRSFNTVEELMADLHSDD